MDIHQAIEHAADLIRQADALIISAGAGMSVDSGLPDFQGISRDQSRGCGRQRSFGCLASYIEGIPPLSFLTNALLNEHRTSCNAYSRYEERPIEVSKVSDSFQTGPN